MPVGPNKTSAGLGGQTPQQNLTGYTRITRKEIFYSLREIALLIDKNVRGGFGALEAGQVMAKDENTDYLVPYVPDTISEDNVGRVMLLQDCDQSDTVVIPLTESYRFADDDVVVLTDTDGSFETATIDSIDRTSSKYKATITLTGAVSGTFEVAKSACMYHKAHSEAGDAGKYCVAKYILDQSILTGEGEDATQIGAQTSVLLSNAVIYSGECVDMDDQAITDLGNVTEDGQYYIVK
ncbi:MAG: hypothetical protein ACOC80_05020 [Petrotogales bacterium]